MLPKVLITNTVPQNVTAPLQDLAEIIMGPSGGDLMPREAVIALAPELKAIINQAELKVDKEFLDAAPQLKIVANVSIGTDNLDLPLLRQRGIIATNAPGFFSYPVAEYVIGGLISVMRRLKETDTFVRSDTWNTFQPGRWDGWTLKGKTLGIIGYGTIGRHLRKLAEAFGMRVLYHSPNNSNEAGYTELNELLPMVDALSIHVPLNPSTGGMINKAFISRLKPGAILVNTARGGVMCEADVVDALISKQLGGAVLDVFENEPKVSAALKTLPNVMLSPHVAGGTKESREASRLCAIRNVAAVLKGEAAETPV